MELRLGDYNITGQTPEESVADFSHSMARVYQVSRPIGANAASVDDRGGETNSATWTIQRVHETNEKAAFFVLNHVRTLPRSGPLTWQTEAGTLTIAHGVLTAMPGNTWLGCTTIHHYAFLGGALSTDAPGTGLPGPVLY